MSSASIVFTTAVTVLPILLIVLFLFLGRWAFKEEQVNAKSTFSITTSAALSILCFFVLDIRGASSIYSSFPTEAIVLDDFSASIIDNSFWRRHYGNEYQIKTDDYNAAYCVPYYEFALAKLEWSCPFKSCQGTLLAWDCGHRRICQDDCTMQVDDQYQQEYDCVSSSDDDGNVDDDTVTTEASMLECADATFPMDSKVAIITDCTKCIALTHEDHEWISSTQPETASMNLLLVSAGLFFGIAAYGLYLQRKRWFAEVSDDKEDPLVGYDDDKEFFPAQEEEKVVTGMS